jgi:hypothetical protein
MLGRSDSPIEADPRVPGGGTSSKFHHPEPSSMGCGQLIWGKMLQWYCDKFICLYEPFYLTVSLVGNGYFH